MRRFTWVLVLLAVAALGQGCAHTSHLSSIPEGARVHVQGADIGETPNVVLRSGWGWIRHYQVRVEKPGYRTGRFVISSSWKADWSLLLLLPGILPYFYTARLDDTYTFKLEPAAPPARKAEARPQAPR